MWKFSEQLLCRLLWDDGFFFMCCVRPVIHKFYQEYQKAQLSSLTSLIKAFTAKHPFIFFQTPKWSEFVQKAYLNKKRMKALIERDRTTIFVIKTNDKNFFNTFQNLF